jgi:hypothetical protein
MAAMQQMATAGIAVWYDRIHKVLGEGNVVLVVSEGGIAGQPTAFYDLVRIENGKIAEHWDIVETIPPTASGRTLSRTRAADVRDRLGGPCGLQRAATWISNGGWSSPADPTRAPTAFFTFTSCSGTRGRDPADGDTRSIQFRL